MVRHKNDCFGRAVIITGMQYGSEGKGAITSYLAPLASIGVRSGAANAGHTIYFNGKKFVMRQIPSIWTNPLAKLVIGVGALVSLDILLEEIVTINRYVPIMDRLYIDSKAHVITKDQIEREKKTDLASRIGSTSAISGEGIGIAMADKVLRKSSCLLAKDAKELKPYITDTVDLINSHLDRDEIVVVEGTQGSGLSLDHGQFPYTTSRDTNATAIAASIGIATHQFEIDVIGVLRTYPIRVAGNSGPFGKDSKEITWDDVTRKSKSKIPIIEQTTVTGKTRRVATFSFEDFKKACQINRPTEIALTFADYLDASAHERQIIPKKVHAFMEKLENVSSAPVTLVKTGPQTTIDFDYYRKNILRRIS